MRVVDSVQGTCFEVVVVLPGTMLLRVLRCLMFKTIVIAESGRCSKLESTRIRRGEHTPNPNPKSVVDNIFRDSWAIF